MKIYCWDWFNKKLNGQQEGGIGRTSRQREVGGDNRGTGEMPGDTERKEEVQDGREVTPCDKT